MRWFKKKATPFDDYFIIGIHEDPTRSYLTSHSWTVPYNYYAQLIGVRLYMEAALIGANAPYASFEITRGGQHLYVVMMDNPVARGNSTYAVWQVSASELLSKSLGKYSMHRLAHNLYLYPGDRIDISIKLYSPGDFFNRIFYVMKQWWIC